MVLIKNIFCVKIFLFLTFLLPLTLFSQDIFQRVMEIPGDETFTSMGETSDGGLVMVGFGDDVHGFQDVIIRRSDRLGVQSWAKYFGGLNFDRAQDVKQDYSGNLIIGGYTFSYGEGNSDIFLLKLNQFGDTIWSKTYGGDQYEFGYSVDVSDDNSYVVAGRTNSYGSGGSDIYIVKSDSIGNELWSRTYGGASWEEARSIKSTFDGGYIVGGYTYSYGQGLNDLYFIKINSEGDTLWTRTYGGGGEDWCYDLVQTNDSGFVAVGYTTSYGAGGRDGCVLKIDKNGSLVWSQVLGGLQGDEFLSVTKLSKGDVAITGLSESFGVWIDAYTVRLDSLGNVEMSKSNGGSGSDVGVKILSLSDGGFVVGGLSNGFSAGPDFYLIKSDSLGNSGCLEFQASSAEVSPMFVSGFGGDLDSGGVSRSVSFSESSIVPSGSYLCLIQSVSGEKNELNMIKVFPNPVLNEVIVSGWETLERAEVKIFDSLGRLIVSQSENNCDLLKIKLEALKHGVYGLKLFLPETERWFVKQFVKN